MSERSILQFKGENIPSPLPPQISIKDVDMDSDTNAQGEVERNRIARKRTISVEWGFLPWDEVSRILKLVKDVYIPVNYPDPEECEFQTRTFYVGDRPVLAAVEDGDTIMWSGLKFDMVER